MADAPEFGLGVLEAALTELAKPLERERSFIMLKPDGVQRGLIGEIIKRFEQKGFKLIAMKMMWAPESLLREHYKDLSTKPFFEGLIKYMNSGPVVAMAWEGKDMVTMGRMLLGETDPVKSMPGTIRGDYAIDIGRNICHGSDSPESGIRECGLWFQESDFSHWDQEQESWIYE